MTDRTLKTGDEHLHSNGKQIGFRLVDFWRWSVSDLVSNVTRGRLAEFIVATALGIDLTKPRDEWQAYDLITPEGIKVEVKSASFIQSWNQKKPSTIMFSTRATRYWDSETNVQARTPKRHADVYIFCLLKHLDKSTIDPLNLDQWEFYVLSTKELDSYKRSKVSITLKSLQKLSSPVSYDQIRQAVIIKHKKVGHGAVLRNVRRNVIYPQEGVSNMYKCILFCCLCFGAMNTAFSQQISNAGLEQWQAFTGYEVPDSFWTTDQVFFAGEQTVSRTADAHSGQYAALVQNRYVSVAGFLTYGRFERIGQTNYFYGWPFTARPSKLTFWYKFTRQGSDTAAVFVFLSKWLGSWTMVGSGTMLIYTDTPSYTFAQLTIDYLSAETPDTIAISFTSSVNESPTNGTAFFVDDILLDYSTGVYDVSNTAPLNFQLNAYPNPFNPQTTIEFSIPTHAYVHLTIFDLLGRPVATLLNESLNSGIYRTHWSPRNTSTGIYYCRLSAGLNIQVKKLLFLK